MNWEILFLLFLIFQFCEGSPIWFLELIGYAFPDFNYDQKQKCKANHKSPFQDGESDQVEQFAKSRDHERSHKRQDTGKDRPD